MGQSCVHRTGRNVCACRPPPCTQDAFELLREMEAANFAPTTRTYSAVLEVCARRRDIIGAERIWKILTDDHTRPPLGTSLPFDCVR